YRASPAAPKQATYLSRVLDGEYRSRWGLFRWHGTHDVTIESRSGNTAKPDVTWTGFAPLEKPRPTAEGGVGQVASPPARYVQYRATFGAPEGRLAAVTLAYLPQNQRARITELGTADSGAPAAPAIGGLGASAPSAPRAHQPVIKLRWKVENPDGDELSYRLAFRQENDAVWRPLGGPDPLTKTEFDWNTEGLPDGNYVVKVTQRRTLGAARARARHHVHVGADPGRQPQARGRRPRLQVPVRVGPRARRPEPAGGDGVFDRRRRLAGPGGRRRHLRRPGRIVHDQAAAAGARTTRGRRARLGQRRQRGRGRHDHPRAREMK